MSKRIIIFFVLVVALMSCKRKEETSYNNLLGDWYFYAAYLEGQDVDILPLAKLFGYDLESTVMHITEQTFVIESEVSALACEGTYVQKGDTIYGTKSDGEERIFYFNDGVLSTIQDIDLIGNVDLRLQKK